jgi:hypothetical protein
LTLPKLWPDCKDWGIEVYFFLSSAFDGAYCLTLTQNQLLALAITSGNDYQDNVKGFGIVKVFKIIQNIQEKDDATKIVQEYVNALELEKRINTHNTFNYFKLKKGDKFNLLIIYIVILKMQSIYLFIKKKLFSMIFMRMQWKLKRKKIFNRQEVVNNATVGGRYKETQRTRCGHLYPYLKTH